MEMETPLKGSGYRVWKVPKRATCTARTHNWKVGVCVGNPPSGALTNWITHVEQTPPGVRKTNFREAIAILQAPNQIGQPRTQSTDTNLGFAFYTYQSAEVALPPEERHRAILLRVVGTSTQGG